MKLYEKKIIILTLLVGISEGIAAVFMAAILENIFVSGIKRNQFLFYLLFESGAFFLRFLQVDQMERAKERHRVILAAAFFEKYQKPEKVSKLTEIYKSDLPCCMEFLNQNIPLFFLQAVFLIIYVGILAKVSISFTGIILSIGILQAIVPVSFGKRFSENYEKTVTCEEQIQNFYFRITEHFDKSCFLPLNYMSGRLKKMNVGYMEVGTQSEKLIQQYKAVLHLFSVLAQFGLFFIGLLFMGHGELGFSEILSEVYLGVKVIHLISDECDQWKNRKVYQKARDRMEQIILRPQERKTEIMDFEHICYKNFSTDYTKYELTFDIYRGEKILIKGANGSGKSTVIKSLLGMLDHYRGTISVDGRNIEGLDLTGCAAYIPQNPVNLNLSLMDLAEDEVCHRMNMDFGIDDLLANTNLDEASSGQARKIQLISAFLTKKPLLIFDEPENSLDEDNQIAFQTWLQQYSGTCIIVTNHDCYDKMGMREILVKEV